MTPQVPFLASSFRVAKTPKHTLGKNATTLVTDAEELAEHVSAPIYSKRSYAPYKSTSIQKNRQRPRGLTLKLYRAICLR